MFLLRFFSEILRRLLPEDFYRYFSRDVSQNYPRLSVKILSDYASGIPFEISSIVAPKVLAGIFWELSEVNLGEILREIRKREP